MNSGPHYKIWQWPNILALDASLIAIAWLWVFSHRQNAYPGMVAYTVLALSVWLTYVADRLFDAMPRRSEHLLSARHQFAKRHSRKLWTVWTVLLLVNTALAITCLAPKQLHRGIILLLFCLAYTVCNQLLSKNFFPKELAVALIFAGGTQVFLPELSPWQPLAAFALICLINCLLLGWKEEAIDTLLRVRSLSGVLNPLWFYLQLAMAILLSLADALGLALLPCLAVFLFLKSRVDSIQTETYRVLCDAALVLGPAFYFCSYSIVFR
ncbi:MAG: hypothetical protein ACPGSB_00580 [Opitutales bacterium]